MRQHNYYVYILTNDFGNVMYIGMTNDLERRMQEHKQGLLDGFSKKYKLKKLVYYEHTHDVKAAITREKEIKKWRREKKNGLVETLNPQWRDLSEDFISEISHMRSK
ncbi:MAG TPA: excinuclease ABC subunit C [Rhodospirillaceae bacterium]|nr:excinuclease ABC subunit C [Rhodospirillaceae bacterium]